MSHDARSVELLQVKRCDFAGVYKGYSTSIYMQYAVYVHSCIICMCLYVSVCVCMCLYTSHALQCMFIYTLTRVCVCVRARARAYSVCVCEHLCAYSVNTRVLT